MTHSLKRILTRSRAIAAAVSLVGLLAFTAPAVAGDEVYDLDPAHSFVTFSISHLGFSFIEGRFNELEGEFVYDPEAPENSRVTMEVATASIDTNHAERDRHLRGEDFLHVSEYPVARFETTGFEPDGEDGRLLGELTLHGETRPIEVDVTFVGAGEDPWGGYRRGYVGTTTIKRSDFGMDYDLGPDADEMRLRFVLEGIRQ
ncbi:YceI family protein [Alkalilimnicola ehrlichii MLHE-1]|uniref:YceI family protein n=1 Tax=Alkalilimnicola ehrlichii (strain ATCC BAA-1101 / DSM 17681 / MLHE-1) TaxID=187272 RepID=Q0A8T3_ALKEH|nr:YceI family protein [Alkalilimnicola ehrlichii]ABI56754.1 YceI family protein [Alkalilimnicola ehrlichii MLHE-1]